MGSTSSLLAKILTIKPKLFEKGVKEAINIKQHRPSLNHDGGRSNLPAVRSKLLKGLARSRGLGTLTRAHTSGNLAALGEVTK